MNSVCAGQGLDTVMVGAGSIKEQPPKGCPGAGGGGQLQAVALPCLLRGVRTAPRGWSVQLFPTMV